MSLDLILEADNRLTETALIAALEKCGAIEFDKVDGTFRSILPRGLPVFSRAVLDRTIHAEDPRGCSFSVSRWCSFPLKGEDPEAEARTLIGMLYQESGAYFVASYQLEKTIAWSDSTGLHWA